MKQYTLVAATLCNITTGKPIPMVQHYNSICFLLEIDVATQPPDDSEDSDGKNKITAHTQIESQQATTC